MVSITGKALRYLEAAQKERQNAWNEYLYGRPYQPYLSIAKEYEELAKKIVGDEAVTKYILSHSGEFTKVGNKLVKVFG